MSPQPAGMKIKAYGGIAGAIVIKGVEAIIVAETPQAVADIIRKLIPKQKVDRSLFKKAVLIRSEDLE